LGRHSLWNSWVAGEDVDCRPLADAAEAMSREGVGAPRRDSARRLAGAVHSRPANRIEAKLTASLIRTVFMPKSPLHDGAMILVKGRVVAAGCSCRCARTSAWRNPAPASSGHAPPRRPRTTEETDAIVLVVSEETGRNLAGVRRPIRTRRARQPCPAAGRVAQHAFAPCPRLRLSSVGCVKAYSAPTHVLCCDGFQLVPSREYA